MTWRLVVARSAQKALERAPARDRTRLLEALRQMAENPLAGDVVNLKGRGALDFRRCVGSWGILFALDRQTRTVQVTAVLRRGSTTY